MPDWVTISALATAFGTLVLAVATFASVRSANRTARAAERSYQLGLRPLLMSSHLEDPVQKIRWVDDHWAHLDGSAATVEAEDGNIYLAMSVRNAGTGIAVMHGWHLEPVLVPGETRTRPDPGLFRRQGRDLYVPAGDVGFWQAAIRDPNDAQYTALLDTIVRRQAFTIDVLYSDHESERRTITRFVVTSRGDPQWLCSAVVHWSLERDDPSNQSR